MKIATINIEKCIQDMHDISDNDSVMVSRIFFTIEFDNIVYSDMHVDISQNYGIDYLSDPIEVLPYEGTFPYKLRHDIFSDNIEEYYRSLVGSEGNGINFGSQNMNIRMKNNIFRVPYQFEIRIIENSSSSW